MQNPHFKHRAKRVGPLRNGTLPKQSSTQYVGAGRGKAQVPSPVKGINKHKSEHGPLKKHKSEKAKGKEEEEGYAGASESDWVDSSGNLYDFTEKEDPEVKFRPNAGTVDRLNQKKPLTMTDPAHPYFPGNFNRPYSKSEELAPLVNSHSSVFASNPPDPLPLKVQRPIENTSAITNIATAAGAALALGGAPVAIAGTLGGLAGGAVGERVIAAQKKQEAYDKYAKEQENREKLHHYFKSEPQVKQKYSAQGRALYDFLKRDNMSIEQSIEKYKKENPAEWKSLERFEPEVLEMAKHDSNRPMYHSGNTHEQFATLYEGSQVTKSENSFDPPPPPPGPVGPCGPVGPVKPVKPVEPVFDAIPAGPV